MSQLIPNQINDQIVGFGIDWTSFKRFRNKKDFPPNLLNRFLTPKEIQNYDQLSSQYSKIQYLASHWAAKEAVFKALNHLLAIPLHKIELVENDCHQLFYYNPQEKLVGFISISFLYDQQVVAVCLLVKYADYQQLARENYLKQLKIIRSKIF